MTDDGVVTLQIEDEEFNVRKSLLCEHSAYFQAMFSGNYVEKNQNLIVIDVVDASSMRIIIKYMEIALIDLYDYNLSQISEIARAANFLQITELIKQIQYTLQLKLSRENWVEIMAIAEASAYIELEQYSAAFGLLCFKEMKTDCIKSLDKLYWYLSHPYLNAWSEVDVFEFGLQWAQVNESGGDSILVILCCLDIRRLTTNDLVNIHKMFKKHHQLSLAAKVVDCLHELSVTCGLSVSNVTENKERLCEMFTERVYTEVLNLVKESKTRNLKYTSAVTFWTKEHMLHHKLLPTPTAASLDSYHNMYKFTEQSGFESWLSIAPKNLWGWGIAQWGPMRLVIVYGEHGRGTGHFSRDVQVYDLLKKEWIKHGVQLPAGRHAGLTVLGDSLFIVGGVGAFRVIQDRVIIYDLKARTFRVVATFHDAIQNPGLCTHDGQVYGSGIEAIYKFDERDGHSWWIPAVRTNIRMNCMMSFKGYIYCTQSYFTVLYRFRPAVDKELKIVTTFTYPPVAICNLGDRLLFFTRLGCGHSNSLAVEEYRGIADDEKPKLVWSIENGDMLINDAAGSCGLVMDMPPLCNDVPSSHNRLLQLCANML